MLSRRFYDRVFNGEVAFERMFKVSPKLHLWVHLTSLHASLWGSPRYWWTYSDEDLVGLLIDMTNNIHINTLATSVLFKWIWLVFGDEDVAS